MELKNAFAVCLISLFSATLVVLIARTLDVQSESRLEPQLAKIVEQLEGLRQAAATEGLLPTGALTGSQLRQASDGVVVYYFHSNTRCPTCREIESQAYNVVHSDFAEEVASGKIQWKVLNYEEPANAELAKRFEIQMPVVVVARIVNRELAEWKNLDRVWALVGDQSGYASYLGEEIRQVLQRLEPQPTLATSTTDETAANKDSGDDPNEPPTTEISLLPIPE